MLDMGYIRGATTATQYCYGVEKDVNRLFMRFQGISVVPSYGGGGVVGHQNVCF